MIMLGFGIVQVGLSLKSHDPSQRANGFLTLAGGVVITFAKEILTCLLYTAAKFYNLPELMQMFREVADIQTADMLKLPVPKVNYHNIKTKPSEIQTEMVAGLAKRA